MERAESSHIAATVAEFRGSSLKRPIVLSGGALRLTLEADGEVSSLHSGKETRFLFGKQSIHLFKFQAGIRVPARKEDFSITVTPFEATFRTRVFNCIDLSQVARLHSGESSGYVRALKLANTGQEPIRVLILSSNDPTAVNFGPWEEPGTIGVNAFNRGDHVAIDEVADGTGVRVIGAMPAPRITFMTRDVTRVAELLQRGDLPDSTAGMTGQLMILTLHEVELKPMASSEITFVSMYHASRLEEAVSTFNRVVVKPDLVQTPASRAILLSSDQALANAFRWSSAGVESLDSQPEMLDRLDSLPGAWTISPSICLDILNQAKRLLSKKGFLPHSSDSTKEGVLESSLFVLYGSRFLRTAADKKLAKSLYPALKKCAGYLVQKSNSGLIRADPTRPSGWRRRLVISFPSGATSEVNLTVAAALREFAALARESGKGAEAARFREASDGLLSSVRSSLFDHQTGALALNLDSRDRLHREQTIDQAVGLCRMPYDANICGSVVHRLLEKDFETGYGPRVVPSSNEVYFNGSYLEGQLGGYWPRAALAHALLAFSAGFPIIGSRILAGFSKLVTQEALKMGSAPGMIPEWVDVERRRSHGEGTDSVAASRLIECVVTGEIGMSLTEAGAVLRPTDSPETKWLLLLNAWFGEETTTLITRKNRRALVLTTARNASMENRLKMDSFESIEVSSPELFAGQFVDPGQVVCVLNPTGVPHSCSVNFPLRDPVLERHLAADLQEFDPITGEWFKVERTKILPRMRLQTNVEPLGCRVFRLTSP